jgi:hypothetical protein
MINQAIRRRRPVLFLNRWQRQWGSVGRRRSRAASRRAAAQGSFTARGSARRLHGVRGVGRWRQRRHLLRCDVCFLEREVFSIVCILLLIRVSVYYYSFTPASKKPTRCQPAARREVVLCHSALLLHRHRRPAALPSPPIVKVLCNAVTAMVVSF